MHITARRMRGEGYKLPRFYGIAWFELDTLVYVCYLWPFNFLLAWFRRIWLKTRFAVPKDPIADAYRQGQEDGYTQGRLQERENILQEILMEMKAKKGDEK